MVKNYNSTFNNLKVEIGCDIQQVECKDCPSLQDCLDEYEFRRVDGLRELTSLKPMCAVCISVVMNQFGNYCLLDECRFHPDYHNYPIEILKKISANISK